VEGGGGIDILRRVRAYEFFQERILIQYPHVGWKMNIPLVHYSTSTPRVGVDQEKAKKKPSSTESKPVKRTRWVYELFMKSSIFHSWIQHPGLSCPALLKSFTDKNREKVMRKRQKTFPNFLKMRIFFENNGEYWGRFSVFFLKFSHDFCQCWFEVCTGAQLLYPVLFHNTRHPCVLIILRF